MRRVSFKFEGQANNAKDSNSYFQFGADEGQSLKTEMGVELPDDNSSGESASTAQASQTDDSPVTSAGGEELGALGPDAAAQQNVERFNDQRKDQEAQSSYVGDRSWAKKHEKPNVFDQSQIIYVVVGSLALIGGGIALLAKTQKKKNKKIYRAKAGRLDERKEVRGAFRPAKRFKKAANPAVEAPAVSGDVSSQTEVSSLVPAQAEPILLVPVPQTAGKFDFAGGLDEAGEERFESEELVESDPESSPVSNDVGLLSARPFDSSQDRELAFVDSANLSDSHFVQSSPAQFAFSELEYSGGNAPEFSGGEPATFGQDKSPDEDSKQVTKDIFQNEERANEMAADSDPELEQEANEFARNFFSDESVDNPVPAINEDEDEEAVMNSKNDDSGLEFDFDLEDAVEINDSDADFNFDMDVEEAPEKPLAELAVAADLSSSPEADEDSAEFAAMFDDSSEDLPGLELNAPTESAADVIAVADDVEIELLDSDLDLEVSGISDEVTSQAEEFDVDVDLADDLDDVIELAVEEDAPEISADLGAKIGDAVEGIGDSVSEKVDTAVDEAAEAVSGLSDSAKAAAVAAGAAGTAAGGGFLGKLFGWGKKKEVAQDTIEDAVAIEGAVDEVELDDSNTIAESDVISEVVASTESAVDVEADEVEFDLGIESEDGEVEFDLGGGESESDEFDFSLDDDEGPELLADQELISEIEVADNEIAAVAAESKQSDDSGDLSIDLLDESGEVFDLEDEPVVDAFDFADVDSAEAEKDNGFSSRDTLREPGAAKLGFSSAETLREPISTGPEVSTETESDGLGIAALGGAAAAGAAALVGLNKSTGQGDAEQESAAATASESVNDELIAKIRELETANSNLESSAKALEEKLAAKEEELAKVAESDGTAELVAKVEELEQSNKTLNESTQLLEEKLAAREEELAKVAESDGTAESKQEELVAKVEELEQSNKTLNESTQLLEEKLEAQAAEAETAIAKVEEDYAAKLEESATGQSEMAAELESVKAELEEAKSSVASEAAEQKDAELEKMQADLEAARSSDESLKQEIESLKQQLADAAAADDHDGMPTSSLMGAAGLGAAGLMGGRSLMDKTADSEPSISPADDDLKKRFEKRLKAERQARKDAEAHLEQAEQQRNDVAQTLRGLKKELVEAQKAATDKPPAKDNSLQLKALESQLERQSDKMKTLGAENDKLSAELKSAQDSIKSLKAENSEFKKKNEVAASEAGEADRAKIKSLELELQQQIQDSEAKHLVAEKQTVELRGSLVEKEQELAGKIEELTAAVEAKDKSAAEELRLRDELRKESVELTSELTSARSLISSLENEKAEFASKAALLTSQPSQEQTLLNETQEKRINELEVQLRTQKDALQQATSLAEKHAQQISVLSAELVKAKEQTATAEQKANLAPAEPKPDLAMKLKLDSLQSKLSQQAESLADYEQLKSKMADLEFLHAKQAKELATAHSVNQSSSAPPKAQATEDLKAELRSQEKRIMELESENHEAQEKLAAMMRLRAEAESRAKSPAVKKNKLASSSKSPGKRLTKGSSKDDLTRIVGIGKVYQGKLNKIGVRSYEQIAAWTKKDVQGVEEQLGLGDRIINEKWIKQAKALLKKKSKQ